MNPLLELNSFGQSVWLDYIRREFITGGALKKLIDEDGKSVFEANSEMVVPTPDIGFEVDIPAVFDIANLQFEKAGTHVWRIEINGQTLPQDTRLEIGLIEPA